MSEKRREPINLADYANRRYRVDEDYDVFSIDGDEKHLGTLVGFVTDDGFHGLYKNRALADDLRIGTVKIGDLKIKIHSEPIKDENRELNYNAMVIRKPSDSFMAEMPIYIIRIRI